MFSIRTCSLIASLLLSIWSGIAAGQGQPIFQEGGIVLPRESERREIRTKGKIQAINADIMQVVTEKGVPFLAKMPPEPQNIHLLGAAQPHWLQAGMLIRFVGEFDRMGKSQAPVQRLEVFTPRPPRPGDPGMQFGVFRLANAQPPAVEGPATPVLPPAAAPAVSAAVPETARFRIVGKLAGVQNSQIAVAVAPTIMVQTALADDAEIVVDIGDYSLAKPGDEIEIEGWYYPQLPHRVTANRVTIRSNQVIGIGKPGTAPDAASDAAKPNPPTKSPAPGTEAALPF